MVQVKGRIYLAKKWSFTKTGKWKCNLNHEILKKEMSLNLPDLKGMRAFSGIWKILNLIFVIKKSL